MIIISPVLQGKEQTEVGMARAGDNVVISVLAFGLVELVPFLLFSIADFGVVVKKPSTDHMTSFGFRISSLYHLPTI